MHLCNFVHAIALSSSLPENSRICAAIHEPACRPAYSRSIARATADRDICSDGRLDLLVIPLAAAAAGTIAAVSRISSCCFRMLTVTAAKSCYSLSKRLFPIGYLLRFCRRIKPTCRKLSYSLSSRLVTCHNRRNHKPDPIFVNVS